MKSTPEYVMNVLGEKYFIRHQGSNEEGIKTLERLINCFDGKWNIVSREHLVAILRRKINGVDVEKSVESITGAFIMSVDNGRLYLSDISHPKQYEDIYNSIINSIAGVKAIGLPRQVLN